VYQAFQKLVKLMIQDELFYSCLVENDDVIFDLISRLKIQASVFLVTAKTSETSDPELIEIGQAFVNLFEATKDLKRNPELSTEAWKPEKVQMNLEPAETNVMKEMSEEEMNKYVQNLKDLQFKMIPIDLNTHKFASQIKAPIDVMATKNRLKRLATEIPLLSTSLPLNFNSGIFARVDENCCDVIKVLIIGTDGTPYWNGCFVFDIFVPVNYPQQPPMVCFMTTGQGSVRFNPNLYECGKICLSLLGTWEGPGWDPSYSTLFQVLLSIQSLILVPEPYYNEPGFEDNPDEQSSNEYSTNIRYQTIRVAMMEMLQKPVPEFEDVINAHFSLKKKQIIQQCQDWAKLEDVHHEMANLSKKFIDLLNERFPSNAN